MRRRLWLIGLVVVAVALAACGGVATSPNAAVVSPGDAEATVRARVELALVGTAVALPSSTPTPAPTPAPTTPVPLDDAPTGAPSPTEPDATAVVSENLSGEAGEDPAPSPTPAPVPLPSPTPSPTPRPTATALPQRTATPTATPSPTLAPETAAQVTARISSAIYKVRTPFGTGSGVAISSDGRILTNYHVIADGSVTVLMADGSIVAATVLGFNEPLDLAVIKIDSQTPVFPPVQAIGDVSLGDEVLAIGFPLGGDISVTAGIVSGTGAFEETDVKYIQTDAAVNPGNSGGALVDLRGRLIGIVTSRVEVVGGRVIQNVGFAIDVKGHATDIRRLESGFVLAVPTSTPQSLTKYGSFSTGFTIDVPVSWIGSVGSEQYADFTWKHRRFRGEDWLFWNGTSATALAVISVRVEDAGFGVWTNQTYMDRLVGEISRPHIVPTLRSVLQTQLISGQDATRFEYDVDYWTDVPYSVESKGVWKSTWLVVTTDSRTYAIESVFFDGAFGDEIVEQMEAVIASFVVPQ